MAHINLLNTVFRDVYDQEIYIRNALLYAGEGIINVRRSGPAYVAIALTIPAQLGCEFGLESHEKREMRLKITPP